MTYTDAHSQQISLMDSSIALNRTGTADGTLTIAPGTTANERIVTISNTFGSGTLGISIAAGTAVDVAGNLAAAAGPSATFEVQGARQPQVTIAGAKTGKRGGTVVLTLNIHNVGNQLSPDAVLTIQLPKFAIFKPAQSDPRWQKVSATSFKLALGNLNVGAAGSVRFAFRIKNNARVGSQLSFTASIAELFSGVTQLASAKGKVKVK